MVDEYRVARRMLRAEVSGVRGRGRPRLRWLDRVKVALGSRERGHCGGCSSMREI